MMKLLKPTINPNGPMGLPTHNMPCAWCLEKSAVLGCENGRFDLCWGCQEKRKIETSWFPWIHSLFKKEVEVIEPVKSFKPDEELLEEIEIK